MTSAKIVLAGTVLFLPSTLAFPEWAQTGASLSGVVTNQTGAALRDVAVTIKDVDANSSRTIATRSDVPPIFGGFEIRAAKKGFADEARTDSHE